MSRGIIEEFREGSSSRLKRTFVSGEVMLNMNQLSEDGVYFLSETDAGSTNFFYPQVVFLWIPGSKCFFFKFLS